MMSIFNIGYIIGGLGMFLCGLFLMFHPIVGTICGIFGILAGVFFLLLGLTATAKGIK